ncbi:hypothetical protein JXA85_07160 [Candidatus Woesearchaeota archaeon]|nr:hypothetical protein [Candidatus Woesearchaeota archaeon]
MAGKILPGPLTSGFLLTSIIGFFVSAFYVYKLTPAWGFTFSVMFLIMFIASMVSLARSSVDTKLRDEIEQTYPKEYKQQLDNKRKSIRRRRK